MDSDAQTEAEYLAILRRDPSHVGTLIDLGNLAFRTGRRKAARTAYRQAVTLEPANAVARINLANALFDAGDYEEATRHYRAALEIEPGRFEAHQGLSFVLSRLGDEARAEEHRRRGFTGHALTQLPYRGDGAPIPVLLLACAAGGNVFTDFLLDDRVFLTHKLYADYYEFDQPLPQHALIFNAVGDAERGSLALARAQAIVDSSRAPVVNSPRAVAAASRIENAARLARIPGVRTAWSRIIARRQLALATLQYPVLLRVPGHHTGRHFVMASTPAELAVRAGELPGDEFLAIDYVDTRSPDGFFRKYRLMTVDERLYPMHLAISSDWKVHYVTSQTAHSAELAAEEQRFLNDPRAVLGDRAMRALERVAQCLDLEYGGIDFALDANGNVVVFEANATMIVLPPALDEHGERHRAQAEAVFAGVREMLERLAAQRMA